MACRVLIVSPNDRSAKKLLSTFDKHVGKKYDAADDETGIALELSCGFAYGTEFCQRDPARLEKFIKYGKRWLSYFPDFLKYAPPYNNPILFIEGKKGKINDAMDFFGQFSRDALAEVRKNPAGKTSWIAKWALTPTEDGSLLDDKEVIASTFDSFMGIPPTFSFILGHGMYLLAKNPTVLERAYREVSAVLTSGSRDITIADFHRMPYLLKVVKEIYRYYPPGGQIYARVSMEDDTLRDWMVPAGTTYMIHAASIHQDPRFWEEPTKFNPDRFDKPVGNHTWIPFGAGKKDCPGKDLALQITNAYFAYIIRNFQWTYHGEDDPPVMRMLLSAATKEPLLFKLQRRSAKDEL
jgi:cytochrome P450